MLYIYGCSPVKEAIWLWSASRGALDLRIFRDISLAERRSGERWDRGGPDARPGDAASSGESSEAWPEESAGDAAIGMGDLDTPCLCGDPVRPKDLPIHLIRPPRCQGAYIKADNFNGSGTVAPFSLEQMEAEHRATVGGLRTRWSGPGGAIEDQEVSFSNR